MDTIDVLWFRTFFDDKTDLIRCAASGAPLPIFSTAQTDVKLRDS
jgi:hypothetical protein